MSAPNTPFALPASLWHSLQGWVQAVGVVADVAVVAQEESPRICGFPTGFTHCALQAPPTFAEYHFSNLNTDTVWMVTLPTLGTGQQPALSTLAKTPTNHTHILMESELVTVREEDNCIMHRVFFLIFIR